MIVINGFSSKHLLALVACRSNVTQRRKDLTSSSFDTWSVLPVPSSSSHDANKRGPGIGDAVNVAAIEAAKGHDAVLQIGIVLGWRARLRRGEFIPIQERTGEIMAVGWDSEQAVEKHSGALV